MRTYKHPKTGESLPSVTTVLDTLDKGVGLLKWTCRLGWDESRRIFKESGERGTRVHDHIVHRVTGAPRTTEPDEGDLPYQAGFDSFLTEVGLKFDVVWSSSEETVYCQRCGYAGTLDWIGAVSRKGRGVRPMIVDWKTTSALRPEAALQTAAYLHAYLVTRDGYSCRDADLNAMTYERWAFRFGEDGEYEPARYRDYKSDIKCFRQLLGVYQWRSAR